ncbi:CC0125/CC1285 family lipoprotein [Caulobacter mirabilis]|uniref:Lipoprotein n=1 Tax=Caulobacter mirabilis TaxID=69666 RepID=A0A2D2AX86_9CAUL|nr:hypothetical protein [Caulobacter mirabilis]ATQ42591.1 hypothetical protein CSW64_09325 [Caulobacter mirabilis]
MHRVLIAAGLALSLAACATTPTVYQPAPGQTGVGFSDYRIESGRYRVTFNGGPGAPMSQVADYALLRAAEVSLADGYDWFRVVDRQDRRDGQPSGGGPRVSVGGGTSSWSGGGWRGSGSSVGIGIGTSFDLSGGPSYSRSIEVLAGKGAKPADSDVYDARDIVRVVGRGERR